MAKIKGATMRERIAEAKRLEEEATKKATDTKKAEKPENKKADAAKTENK